MMEGDLTMLPTVRRGKSLPMRLVRPIVLFCVCAAATTACARPSAAGGNRAADSESAASTGVLTSVPPNLSLDGLQTVAAIESPTKIPAKSVEDAVAATMRGLDAATFQKVATTVNSDTKLPELQVAVNVPGVGDGGDLIPEWEAALLAGVAAERLTAAGAINKTIGSYEYVAVDPKGKVLDQEGAALPPNVAGAVFPASKLDDVQIVSKIKALTKAHGFSADSIKILHPLGPAIVITVRLPSGAVDESENYRLWQVDLATLDGLSGKDQELCATEGYAVKVVDSAGKTVMVATRSCRTGAGSYWALPGGPIDLPHGSFPPLAPTSK